jgi:hypothetical protein
MTFPRFLKRRTWPPDIQGRWEYIDSTTLTSELFLHETANNRVLGGFFGKILMLWSTAGACNEAHAEISWWRGMAGEWKDREVERNRISSYDQVTCVGVCVWGGGGGRCMWNHIKLYVKYISSVVRHTSMWPKETFRQRSPVQTFFLNQKKKKSSLYSWKYLLTLEDENVGIRSHRAATSCIRRTELSAYIL